MPPASGSGGTYGRSAAAYGRTAGAYGRSLLARGRAEARVEWRDARDRFVASDPGLSRLRHGLRAAISVATTVGVEALFAQLTGVTGPSAMLHIMLGAVVALNMATSIRDPRRSVVLRTVAGSPVAAVLGAGAAILTAPVRPLATVMFVVVSFLAVYVRRFGPGWFTYGFVAWQSFFFATFLRAPVSALSGLVVSILVATTWVGLLLTTVLHADPQGTLLRTITALRARTRGVVSAAVDVMDAGGTDASLRRLRAQLVQTNEVALLLDGQLSSERALPDGVEPQRIRRWLVDLEIGCDEVASAVEVLVRHAVDDAGDPANRPTSATLSAARRMLDDIRSGRLRRARADAARLMHPPLGGQSYVRRLGNGAGFLVDTIDTWASGRLLAGQDATQDAGRDDGQPVGAATPRQDMTTQDPHEQAQAGFEPVITLQGGSLPGSADLASAVAAREDHWWSRMRFTTRRAIQAGAAAAMAVLLGQLISTQRFYWAVMAAFITFTGTSSTGETVRKAVGRTAGTLAGLFVAVGLAEVTAWSTPLTFVTLIVCIFLAFYVQALSNSWTIFFITLMLGELYGLLHTLSDTVLLLRLEETAAGALAGIVASFLVLPVSATDTLKEARRLTLTRLAGLLDDCGALLRGTAPQTDPLVAVVAVDEAARQAGMAHSSVLSVRLLDQNAAGRTRRVAVLQACAAGGRSVLQAVMVAPRGLPPEPAEVCDLLAAECRRLSAVPDLKDQRPAPQDRPGLVQQVTDLLEHATDQGVPVPLSRRLLRLTDALALLTPRGRG